jgi:hypothetical protein
MDYERGTVFWRIQYGQEKARKVYISKKNQNKIKMKTPKIWRMSHGVLRTIRSP